MQSEPIKQPVSIAPVTIHQKVISINKVTQILKVLYPDRIRPEDLCEVYENVIPQIQKLIGGVDLGYHSTKPIEYEHVDATVDSHLSTVDTITPPKAVVVTTENDDVQDSARGAPSAPHKKQPIELAMPNHFDEDEKRIIDVTWTENAYDECTYYKKGEAIVIKGESARIDTTWDCLNEFFDALPDEMEIRDILGLNKKKRFILMRFYEAHPNFSCRVEKVNNVNVFKKDEVRLNTNTNGNGESGSMDVDSFNGVSTE